VGVIFGEVGAHLLLVGAHLLLVHTWSRTRLEIGDASSKEQCIPRAPRPYLVNPPCKLQVDRRIYQGVDTRIDEGVHRRIYQGVETRIDEAYELFAASPYTNFTQHTKSMRIWCICRKLGMGGKVGECTRAERLV